MLTLQSFPPPNSIESINDSGQGRARGSAQGIRRSCLPPIPWRDVSLDTCWSRQRRGWQPPPFAESMTLTRYCASSRAGFSGGREKCCRGCMRREILFGRVICEYFRSSCSSSSSNVVEIRIIVWLGYMWILMQLCCYMTLSLWCYYAYDINHCCY